jgi:hypothetical protein
MKYLRTKACAICGEEQPGHETRFLVAESPQSLQVILDALLEALRRETVGQADGISKREEEREEESCVVSSEPEY